MLKIIVKMENYFTPKRSPLELLEDASAMKTEKRTRLLSNLWEMHTGLMTFIQIIDSAEFDRHFPTNVSQKQFLEQYIDILMDKLAEIEIRSKQFYVASALLRVIREEGGAR